MSKGRGGVHKDARHLVQAALDAGWTLTHTGKGHPCLNPPDGSPGVTMSMSPRSSQKMIWCLRRDLRKRGLNV